MSLFGRGEAVLAAEESEADVARAGAVSAAHGFLACEVKRLLSQLGCLSWFGWP